MGFGNLRIGSRLALGFGLTLIFMVVLIAVGISRMTMINHDVHVIVHIDQDKLNQQNLLYDTIRENAIEIRNLVLLKSEADMAASADLIQNRRLVYESLRGRLGGAVDSAEGKELLANIDAAAAEARLAEDEVIELGKRSLDLLRINGLAAGEKPIVSATLYGQIPVFVPTSQVAGTKPSRCC